MKKFLILFALMPLAFTHQNARADDASELSGGSSTAEITGGSSTADLAATPTDAFDEAFVVTPPERAPASAAAKAIKGGKTLAGKVSSRRSRLPAEIKNGFELRVQNGKLNEMFWVVERNRQFDLIYANSSDSKSSLSLSPFDFNAFYESASSFKPYEGSLAKCKQASMQLHVIAANKPEQTVTMCLNQKGKVADNLRNLGNALGSKIR